MKKLFLIPLLMLVLGCATTSGKTDTTMQTAGKSLLAAKSTIVTSATAVDGLCKAKTIPADKCAEAKKAYEESKPAYDSAVDAYLLTSQGYGTPAELDAAVARLQAIALRLLTLSGGTK